MRDLALSLCQGPVKLRQHNRALKKVTELKNAARKALRRVKRNNSSEEAIRTCAGEFLSLLREHSRLKKASESRLGASEAKAARQQCHRNFWRYARELLDKKLTPSISPTFSEQTAHDFFTKEYSSQPHQFTQPTWMPSPVSPKYPMSSLTPVTSDELMKAIRRSRSSSAPSPLDQIPYQIFKHCPSLVPALLDLFNSVLLEGVVPSSWKNAVVKLIGKSSATENPGSPGNFRSIALTPAISKLLSGILKDRWLLHMTSNGYLDANVQKAFLPTVPGVTEHHCKLAAIIKGARTSKRSLAVAWLDIANAYGSVHHSLIQFVLQHYHAPPEFSALLQSWYSGLSASISTADWVTPAVSLETGVYQGDPLSVVLFLSVMATLSDTLSTRNELGVAIPHSDAQVNHLLYADDTCITAQTPAACQVLLDMVQQWLGWAGMKAKPTKSRVLGIKASTGKPYDPLLRIDGECIQPIGESNFKFLGMLIHVPPNPAAAKISLQVSLETMLKAIDSSPVTSHQKLRLYRQGVSPRLTWSLQVEEFPISFFEKVLQPRVTRFLKKWSGLARSANPALLFLPPRRGGLGLPSLTALYKKQQVSRHMQLLSSRDSAVRDIAHHYQLRESAKQRQKFKPAVTAQLVLDNHPGLNRKAAVKRARALVATEEEEMLTNNLQDLPQQGEMMRQFDGNAAALWARSVGKLPPEPLRFALNATVESLPTNSNLHKWGKRASASCILCQGNQQSLLHILNGCPVAMSLRRYAERHDNVLQILSLFVKQHLKPSYALTADLSDEPYAFPQHITPTNLRPDLVWWSEQ